MITKERLEELIEQGATIYRAYADVCVEEFKLNKDYKVSTAHLWKKMKHSAFKSCGYPLDQLFETKEDAEEYAEFGNITRTERLELPSWASIEKDFNKFTNGSYVLAERDEFSLELKISKPLISQIIIYTEDDDYNWNLSRENYNEARRLCVKLFKGEKI